jgi:inhibitor of cysteine peptidase
MKKIIVFFVIVLLLQGFSNSVLNSTNEKYTIKLNESFSYSLKSNPTTGYRWQWVNKSSCTILDTFNTRYISDCKTEPKPGCGGTETWNFKGIKKGAVTVRLKYSRSLDPSSGSTIKNVIVKVI